MFIKNKYQLYFYLISIKNFFKDFRRNYLNLSFCFKSMSFTSNNHGKGLKKSFYFKSSFPFYFNNKICPEVFRFSKGIDIEISDKTKRTFSFFEIPMYSFEENKKNTNLRLLNGKADLILFFTTLQKGILVKCLLKVYPKVKEDLIDIVKYKEKDRMLILIKGSKIEDLLLYSFNPKYWLKICSKIIYAWHKIKI
jgi:hypothetical protein